MAEDEAIAIEELRVLLNQWDPIGVSDEASDGPADEYDCLYYPLLVRLRRGESAYEIASFLQADLREHFGISSPGHPFGFAERLVEWWSNRS